MDEDPGLLLLGPCAARPASPPARLSHQDFVMIARSASKDEPELIGKAAIWFQRHPIQSVERPSTRT